MSGNHTCSTCRYFVRDGEATHGECRRYPPTLNQAALVALVLRARDQGMDWTYWHGEAVEPGVAIATSPGVDATHWCGEWVASEPATGNGSDGSGTRQGPLISV